MTKLGEAAYDERGALAYGQPGDQTGLEVRILDFYIDTNRPWTLVFRAKKQEVRDKLALAMTQACENENIGYAQYGDGTTPYKDRYGLRYAIDNNTPSHTIPDVTVPCNCDCSSLVAQCCRAAGIDIPSTMRTAQEQKILMNTGEFDQLNFVQGMQLIPGDIMWRNGHTAIITGIGDEYDKNPKWVGKVTGSCSVYVEPSIKSGKLPQWPSLGKDNLVDVCDEADYFYYVRIAGKYFGFVLTKFVENANPEPAPTPSYKFIGRVTQTANLRIGPGDQYQLCNIDRNDGQGVRHVLYPNEKAPVLAEQNGWYQILIQGSVFTWTPWINANYMVNDDQPAPQPTEPTGIATTVVNLRIGPGTQYQLCGIDRNDGKGVRHVLYTGETAPIIGQSNGWYQLKIVGATATWNPWVSGNYFKKI